MIYLRRFIRFWYDFVVGDDWTVALGVVAALAATWFVTHHGWNWYWLLPATVVALIAVSLRRFCRRTSGSSAKTSSSTSSSQLETPIA